MSVLAEDLRDVLAWVIEVGARLRVRIVVPLGDICVTEVYLDLRAS